MRKTKDIMQPLHVVIPRAWREKIVLQALMEGVSTAEVAREILAEGMRNRGMEI